MSQTIIMAASAIYLVAHTAYVTANGFLNLLLFRVCPLILGCSLGFFAVARFMGWPA